MTKPIKPHCLIFKGTDNSYSGYTYLLTLDGKWHKVKDATSRAMRGKKPIQCITITTSLTRTGLHYHEIPSYQIQDK